MSISFQESWLSDPAFKDWLLKVPTYIYSAKCTLCPRALINIRTMGRSALSSHMTKCKKHVEAAAALRKTGSMRIFVSSRPTQVATSVQQATSTVTATSTASASSAPTVSAPIEANTGTQNSVAASKPETLRGLNRMLLNDDVTKAEILWCLECVVSHKSARSAASDVSLFPVMFADSVVAKKMQLQKDKIGYTLQYGLTPFFTSQLESQIENSSRVVVSFDESLNKISKRIQMDILVRFWDSQKNKVVTRYFTSAFLNRATAVHLLTAFKEKLPTTVLKKLLQVSMDGPNVNLSFMKELKTFLKEVEMVDTDLLDIGTCGLHVVHGAFKGAMVETKWKIIEFLRAIYNVFKDVPSRRALYTSITQSDIFPLKFCAIRWLENEDVAQRALDMLPFLKKIVENVEEKNKPKCASYAVIEESLKDKLLGPKIAFFKTLTADLTPFLREFQSDWPLAPFLQSALTLAVETTMRRFVRPEKISPSIDLKKESNLLDSNHVKIGYATEKEFKKCKKSPSDLDIKRFRNDCKRAMIKFVSKMMEKSPLKYKLTKGISCFDPAVACTQAGLERLHSFLQILVEKNWMDGGCADKVEVQFSSVIAKTGKPRFESFIRTEERLDDFWMKCLNNDGAPRQELQKAIEIALTVSHGQAAVERGFSVNKECLFENMREESLVSRRVVYDAVKSQGGVQQVPITKSLIHSARNARERYNEALKKRKDEDVQDQDARAKRKSAEAQIRELEEKRARLEGSIQNAEKEKRDVEKEISSLAKTTK